MDSQLLLLIIIGVFIVAIAIAVGVSIYEQQHEKQTTEQTTEQTIDIPASHKYTVQKITAVDGCGYIVASSSNGIAILHSPACTNISHK